MSAVSIIGIQRPGYCSCERLVDLKREARAAHAVGDRLDAGADDDLLAVDDDAPGRGRDRVEARGTVAADRDAGRRDGAACLDRGEAADVVPGRALGRAATEDDFVDLAGSTPARSIECLMAWPAMATPPVLLNPPRWLLASPVRAVETMTASRICVCSCEGKMELELARCDGAARSRARRAT